jgi:dihydroxyacid dehydratase/phosphogluconate dehydratase
LATETRFKSRTILEDRNRAPARTADPLPSYEAGVFAKYAAFVSSASEGAVASPAGFRP